MNKSTCKAPGCQCQTDGQAYCSSSCQQAAQSGTAQRSSRCECGHPDCDASAGGRSAGQNT
ncbi:MAG: hypothetical protein IPK07_11855 [Deltaproteobacteria bacterium]|nr:hypothetical protein [Deltaproteobacteria bacterium]